MQLQTYIRALSEDSDAPYTPSTLDVPGSLCERFVAALRKSDHEYMEYGNNLFFNKISGELSIGSVEYQGRGTSVDLETQVVVEDNSYVGDFHTHPYRLHYGPNVSIGPSNADWNTWHRYRPRGFAFGLHFVASGSDLFCIIFRKKADSNELKKDGVRGDALRINEIMLVAGDDAVEAYFEANEKLRKHKKSMAWVFEKHSKLSEIPRVHERDAHQMSIDLSSRHYCEYYRGRLDGGRSTLNLFSNRVWGNWLTVNMWHSTKQPWINRRFW